MKLLSHKSERRGDKVSVTAKWRDEMRRPAVVKLSIERASEPDSDSALVSSDVKDVTGTLFGLAEIAWSMGWRPRGFMGFLARQVETYKIPPEAK